DNRATNVPVRIEHADGEDTVTVDQTQAPEGPRGLLQPLGVFTFDGEARVTVSNDGADGYVILDAVRFKPVD
ncbi:MAG: hypothetical protein ACLFV4_03455, partial [Candidatus Hydrogenedentota bacterium]